MMMENVSDEAIAGAAVIADLPGLHVRLGVKAEDGLRTRVLQRALFDHQGRAALFARGRPFLRWLKDELDRAAYFSTHLAQDFRDAQPDRGVYVVAAGVLDAGVRDL
jgi:hypothetical protein